MNNDPSETAVNANCNRPTSLTTASSIAFTDGNPAPTFVIDTDHVITHWNKACEQTLGRSAHEMIGTAHQWQPFYEKARPVLADLIVSGVGAELVDAYYRDKFRRSALIPDAYEVEDFFARLGDSGRWLVVSAAPLRDDQGVIVGAIQVMQDITRQKMAELNLYQTQLHLEQLVANRTDQLARANTLLEEDVNQREVVETQLLARNAELTELNAKLSTAQAQLVQSEKLASIGQLAAGVAHEINNPIGYIFSNFNSLSTYLEQLFAMLAAYEAAEVQVTEPHVAAELAAMRKKVELDFLKEDIPVLMSESKEGIVRVRKIVQDLKDFSRVQDDSDWQWVNLHQGIDATLNIVNNEVKYRADVVKQYGDLPEIECLPSEINQVVMNIVVNAAHAIGPARGTITIRTEAVGDHAVLEISDSGCGIPKENLSRIFDPFFTTKPIGKGTGLGLSLSYGIIQKHRGQIEVESEPGKGTTFRITLPIRHAAQETLS
jgi:signal transduction histidine kinase